MNPAPSIPPLRDLPPGRLEAHHAHLLTEIGRGPRRHLRRPGITWTSLRVAAVAGASAAAAAAIAVGVTRGAGAPLGHSTSRRAAVPRALAVVSHVSPSGTTKHIAADYFSADALRSDETSFARHRGVRGPRAVVVLAWWEAVTNGDRHPTAVQWVRTTRQLAVSSQSGDRVDSPGRQVYFVVLHGRFVDNNAYFLGSGANAPRGTVLSFTIDRRSGQILDFALGNRNPDYAKIGRPHRFGFGKVRRTK